MHIVHSNEATWCAWKHFNGVFFRPASIRFRKDDRNVAPSSDTINCRERRRSCECGAAQLLNEWQNKWDNMARSCWKLIKLFYILIFFAPHRDSGQFRAISYVDIFRLYVSGSHSHSLLHVAADSFGQVVGWSIVSLFAALFTVYGFGVSVFANEMRAVSCDALVE